MLMVYYVQFGLERTYIVLPVFLRWFFSGARLLKLGILYYVYMAALCVFCTNSVNILAGINGLEGGQALVLAICVVVFNLDQMSSAYYDTTREAHLNSIYFLVPFIGVCLGYLRWNWYPAKVFGGDTFAYFSGIDTSPLPLARSLGMLFAVVAIQGHFTVTVLLFMLPQVFNFLYSCPQLFGFVDCPRHRMPAYAFYSCPFSNNLGMSARTIGSKRPGRHWRRLAGLAWPC